MPTIGNNQFPYPNTSDEPNIPGDLQKLALAVDTAIGGGNRLIDTLATLQAIPNTQLFEGMRATVTNDPTTGNNGEYVYTGGAWVSQTPTLTRITTDQISFTSNIIGARSSTPLMVMQISWINNGSFTSTPWASVNLLTINGWKATRETFGWLQDNNANGETRYSSTFYAVGNTISWRDSGTHLITAGAWHNGGLLIPITPA